MLVGLRSALGFGQAITEPSAASLLGDYYPTEERGKAFSIQQMMLFVGAGLGIGLGGAIGSHARLALGPRDHGACPARSWRSSPTASRSPSAGPPT